MSQPGDENRAIYEQLMAQYRSSIEQECLAYQSLQSPDLSHADLVQEVALRVWERIGQFRGLELRGLERRDHESINAADGPPATSKEEENQLRNLQFEAWLRKTSRSVLNNLYRDRKTTAKRNPGHDLQSLDKATETPASTSSASSIVQQAEELSRVRKVLSEHLAEDQRTVVMLHIHHNHTFQEIAQRLGISYDQVRHKYRTALKQMESELSD